MLNLLKYTQNPVSLLVQCCARSGKAISGYGAQERPSKAMVLRSDQANLQPILNRGAEGASLTIFVTDCLQNEKNLWK